LKEQEKFHYERKKAQSSIEAAPYAFKSYSQRLFFSSFKD